MLRPMPEVAIVVDTTHYMPRELVEANGLHEVSLYVNQGDRHERESDMPDFDAFYEGLRTSAQLPTRHAMEWGFGNRSLKIAFFGRQQRVCFYQVNGLVRQL